MTHRIPVKEILTHTPEITSDRHIIALNIKYNLMLEMESDIINLINKNGETSMSDVIEHLIHELEEKWEVSDVLGKHEIALATGRSFERDLSNILASAIIHLAQLQQVELFHIGLDPYIKCGNQFSTNN